jgi:F-type H+-transporting ATPase subunit delta
MIDAKAYGRALFLITEEENLSDKVLADVKTAEKSLRLNPEYVKLLDSPAIPKEERVALADKAFNSLNVNLLNLIKILIEKRDARYFNKVANEYYSLYDESRGILRVEAVTAIPLTDSQRDAMTKKLSSSLNKTVILSNTVDKTTLGGVKIRYSGVQLDGSVKTRLDKFESALMNSVI